LLKTVISATELPLQIYQNLLLETKYAMATPIQENLVSKNKAYASSFAEGHLALPPAKKYAVGITSTPSPLPSSNNT
jgi:hypothetical protein